MISECGFGIKMKVYINLSQKHLTSIRKNCIVIINLSFLSSSVLSAVFSTSGRGTVDLKALVTLCRNCCVALSYKSNAI